MQSVLRFGGIRMDKLIYFYKDDLSFDHVGVIVKGEKVPENATLAAPQGYEPFTYDQATDTWSGIDEKTWNASHPDISPEPTEQDKINAMVFEQIAALQTEK